MYGLKKSTYRKETLMFITGPDGTPYCSIAEMCDDYGIKYTTYKNRLRSGMSMEEALSKPIAWSVIGPNGKLYRSMKEMCNDYDRNYYSVMNYIRRGKSMKEALLAH